MGQLLEVLLVREKAQPRKDPSREAGQRRGGGADGALQIHRGKYVTVRQLHLLICDVFGARPNSPKSGGAQEGGSHHPQPAQHERVD